MAAAAARCHGGWRHHRRGGRCAREVVAIPFCKDACETIARVLSVGGHTIARREPVSASKIWLITIAFLAGTFITPFLLILTTGGDDASLPPFRASPISDSSGLSLQQTAPTKFTPPDESITSAHVM